MNNILLLAAGVGIPLLAIAIILIRRFTASRQGMLFDLSWKVLLYATPAIGVLGVLALLLLKNWNLLMLSIYLVVAMVAGPLFFLWYGRKEHRDVNLSGRMFKLLVCLYFVGFAVSVLLLSTSAVRPYLYYGIIAVVATLLLLQIVLFDAKQHHHRAILLQISLLVLNVIWGMNLKDYFYIGRTDMLAHSWYVENLLRYGFVTTAFGDYEAFPLWHILAAALYMITGATFPIWAMMYFAIGLIYVLIPLGIYLIVLKVIRERRIALLSALFASLSPFFILLGSEAMARSVGSCLGIVLLLLLLDSKSKSKFALALLLTLGIIVFHTVGIMYILLILLVTYLAQMIFTTDKKSSFLSLKYFLVSIALVVVYWSLFAGTMVQTLLFSVRNLGPGYATNTMASVISTPASELFNYFQYTPFLFFIIVGIIFVLKSQKISNMAKLLCITALALIPLTFPGPAIMLDKLLVEVELDRFFENGFLFMALAAGAGFFALFYRSGRVMKTFLVVLFAVMVLLAVSNDFVATDNPLVKRPFYTHYLTSGETAGASLVAGLAPGHVMTDFVITKYLVNSPYVDKPGQAQVSRKNLKFLKIDPDDLFLIRSKELNIRPLYLFGMNEDTYQFGGGFSNTSYYPKESALWNELDNYSRVFDTNSFQVYN